MKLLLTDIVNVMGEALQGQPFQVHWPNLLREDAQLLPVVWTLRHADSDRIYTLMFRREHPGIRGEWAEKGVNPIRNARRSHKLRTVDDIRGWVALTLGHIKAENEPWSLFNEVGTVE